MVTFSNRSLFDLNGVVSVHTWKVVLLNNGETSRIGFSSISYTLLFSFMSVLQAVIIPARFVILG